MYGRATLAIVVSSACMTVAVIVQAVISTRRSFGSIEAKRAVILLPVRAPT